MLTAYLRDGTIAEHAPHIYSIYSRKYRAIYIGQTISRYGALGRLSQHLSNTNSNTFKQRLCQVFNYDEIDVGEVEFFAFRLPNRKSFNARNSDYREAVEHLVNYGIIGMIGKTETSAIVISRTRGNSYTSLRYVGDAAKLVIINIQNWLAPLL